MQRAVIRMIGRWSPMIHLTSCLLGRYGLVFGVEPSMRFRIWLHMRRLSKYSVNVIGIRHALVQRGLTREVEVRFEITVNAECNGDSILQLHGDVVLVRMFEEKEKQQTTKRERVCPTPVQTKQVGERSTCADSVPAGILQLTMMRPEY